MSQTATTLTTAVEKRMCERLGGTPSQKLGTTNPSSEKLNRDMIVKTCSRWTLIEEIEIHISVLMLSYLYMVRKVLSLSAGTLWGRWKSWRGRLIEQGCKRSSGE